MERLRRWGWGTALILLALDLGRPWFSDLRVEAATPLRGALGLARGDGGGIQPVLHPTGEALITLALIAAWVALALVAPRRWGLGAGSLGGRLPLAAQLLIAVGAATPLVLLVATIAPGLAGPALVPVVMLVAAVGLAIVGRRAAEPDVDAADDGDAEPRLAPQGSAPEVSAPQGSAPEGSGLARLIRPAVGVASLAALLLLAGALVRAAVRLAFYRPAAAGDEANFWWRATDVLHQLGWDRYLTVVDSAGYVPGYPLAGNALLGWAPDAVWAAAGRALPFLYGFLVLALLLRPAVRRGSLLGPRGLLGPTAGLLYVIAYVLLIQGDWIQQLFFWLWYGESLATLLTIVLFILVDHARRRSPGSGRAWAAGMPLALTAVGLGAISQVSKPPLSFLLVPAILPTLLLGGLVLRRRGGAVRPLLIAIASTAAGAAVTSVLWGVQQGEHGIGSYYALDARTLLTFHPDGSIGPLVRYFLSEYQPTWTAFLLVAAMALLHDPRRFLPPLLVALGMAASILLLYLGAWSDIEHESGARYLLHGLDGFTLFALAALTPAIRETAESWLGLIAAAVAPGAARRRAPGARVA